MFYLNENNTFSEWGNYYLHQIQPNISLNYHKSLICNLNHANKFIGNIPMNQIKAHHIDDMLSSLAQFSPTINKPLGKRTLKYIRNLISRIFEFAIENDILLRNPAKGRKIPKKAVITELRSLNQTEQHLVFITKQHKLYITSLIFMLAGLRRGELICLEWSDIDFDNCEIIINKSVYENNNKFIIQHQAKTDLSIRRIKIPLFLLKLLKQSSQYTNSRYICSNSQGNIHTPSSWRSAWKSYISSINEKYWSILKGQAVSKFNPKGLKQIIYFTPQMLRHTYATLLYLSEVDVKTTSHLLGHSNVITTLQIYTHIQNSMLTLSITKLDEYLSEQFKSVVSHTSIAI